MLEVMVPPPQKVLCTDGRFIFRYGEKAIQEALVQKLARVISALHAAGLLFEHGFVQEQAAIHRMLDEFHENIMFLAGSVLKNAETPVHQRYLKEFWKEGNNGMVRRQEIRDYVAAIVPWDDGTTAANALRTAYKVYSGYLHGASPQIMELFQGSPPRFQLHGVIGTSLHKDHEYDLYNPFFRAIISFAVAAKAWGQDELCKRLNAYLQEFDTLSGRNEAYRPDKAEQPLSAESPPTPPDA
jgi:hypothetical protein